jgi:hypothetical protein
MKSTRERQLPNSVMGLSAPLRQVLVECWSRDWSIGCTLSVVPPAASVSLGSLRLRLTDATCGRVRAEMTTGLGEGWRSSLLAPKPRRAVDVIEGLFEARKDSHSVFRTEPEPAFRVGEPVRVLGQKAVRYRSGIVRRIVWHHRIGRWMYLLDHDGPIELRFWSDELESKSSQVQRREHLD